MSTAAAARKPMLRTLTTIVGFAAVTAALGFGVALPHTTYADNDKPVVQYTPEGTKIGDIFLKGNVVKDAKSKTGWFLVVTAENKSDNVESCEISSELTRTVGSPMARVRPSPQMVFSANDAISVAAHGRLVKKYEIPAPLAAQLTSGSAATAPSPSANGNMRVPMTTTSFGVMVKSV
jgi:hypothetical protein